MREDAAMDADTEISVILISFLESFMSRAGVSSRKNDLGMQRILIISMKGFLLCVGVEGKIIEEASKNDLFTHQLLILFSRAY